MFCSNCGKEISENASFCGNCGTKIKEDKKQKFDFKFVCYLCGECHKAHAQAVAFDDRLRWRGVLGDASPNKKNKKQKEISN